MSDTQTPTVVYVFSPSCGWCKRNAANIRSLARQKDRDFRFIGISTSSSGLSEYLSEHPLQFPVYVDPDDESFRAYLMAGTPRTIVLSPQRAVLKDFPGGYLPHLQQEVESYFSVSLPGLGDPEPPRAVSGIAGNGSQPQENSACTDALGQEFSPGWVSVQDGIKKRCGNNGVWVTVH